MAQHFVCKQVRLVWQPCRSLWWNVLRQSSLARPAGLQRELGMCGAMSWLQLDLSASTCAWSRLALRVLGIDVHCATGCGGNFVVCGVRRDSSRRASKSWSSVLQSFELWRPFGRLECMSGKPMLCRAGPATPKRCKRHSDKHLTSWFAHPMRCSCGCVLTCMASWDSTTFFWRGCLMHVVCVCVCVATGALHLWTQLLLGGAVRCNRMHL